MTVDEYIDERWYAHLEKGGDMQKHHTIKSFIELMQQKGGRGAITMTYLVGIFSESSGDTSRATAFHAQAEWLPRNYASPLTTWEALRATYELWPDVFEQPEQDEGCECREAGETTFCGRCNEVDAETEDEEEEGEGEFASLLGFIEKEYPDFFEKYSMGSDGDEGVALQMIMEDLREAKRLIDAFPLWEAAWKQINVLAKFLDTKCGDKSQFDDKMTAKPEVVVALAMRESERAINSWKEVLDLRRKIHHIATYLKEYGLDNGVWDPYGNPIPSQVAMSAAKVVSVASKVERSTKALYSLAKEVSRRSDDAKIFKDGKVRQPEVFEEAERLLREDRERLDKAKNLMMQKIESGKQKRALNQDVEVFYMVWNPDGMTPSVRHYSVGSAETEALRLAKENRGKSFFVLKSILMAADNGPVVTRLGLEDEDISFQMRRVTWA